MTIRDHIPLLQTLPFFQLKPKELEALTEFNKLYRQALAEDLVNCKRLYRLPIEHLKHYKNIRIEGEHYLEYEKARWQVRFPDTQIFTRLFSSSATKLKPLIIEFPESVIALGPASWIRLAVAPEGKYFYHHLHHCLNNCIQQRADSNLPLEKFYTELNCMDNEAFYQELQKNPCEESLVYQRLGTILSTLNYQKQDLACTNGKAIDFIVSEAAFNLLGNNKKKQSASPENFNLTACRWSEQEYRLLHFAAEHGCYRAATIITKITINKIQISNNRQLAIAHYQAYCTQYAQIFAERYKAAGALVLIDVQRVLAYTLLARLAATNPIETENYNNGLQKEIFSALISAQEWEESHKNALRLCYKSDDCQQFIEELYSAVTSSYPIKTTYDAILHLYRSFPHLTRDFAAIEKDSSIRMQRFNGNELGEGHDSSSFYYHPK